MKKLFLINCRPPMVEAFKGAGCDVRTLWSTERELDVPALLDENNFIPDLVLQQESLGRRVFLSGLEKLDCLKIFWSVDTHLNMHWHGLYGSLFDGVLTTQQKYIAALNERCHAEICWVPWMGARPGPEIGTASGVVPYRSRKHDICFVGRVSKERRSRQWFVDYLRGNYDLHQVDGLNYSQMMEEYRQTRIVPNEAIFGEVNFRLFEACSCGCAVVTPDIGDELGNLFEIGREIEVYSDVLELKEILDALHRDPVRAASMGLAAYERILRDHLPANRASRILDFAGCLGRRSVSSSEAKLYRALSEAALGEAGDPVVNWDALVRSLLSLSPGMERDSALMRIFSISDMADLFLNIARPYMRGKGSFGDCYFNMSASLSAMKLDLWDVAKHFWYAWKSADPAGNTMIPDSPLSLLLLWGDELSKSGNSIRSGVAFNEKSGIPACAADCYFAALFLSPGNLDVFRKLDSVFCGVKGAEPSRLGFLSHISLHSPDDWRASSDVGIINLKVFRIYEGLKELENARALAVAAGRERFFKRKLETELPQYFRLVYGT
ncbi:glycosyltransferase family protein [Maridesulfovibrio sp. FT414]|uniref:glycosyltransferase family protein n=1 Tax=Maridesulfovibrio sp. FT414 TaxID=2979469 RepID=UPI003D802545